MRPLKVWHRVGPPTWRRSGTLVFTAVIGVLLIGGTAMAANLGLLTSTAPRDRGYRLDVPRPALSVSLPPTSSTSSNSSTSSTASTVDSTSTSEVGEEEDHDTDEPDGGADGSPRAEHTGDGHSGAADHDSDGVSSGHRREADIDDDVDTDEDSTSTDDADDQDRRRSRSNGSGRNDGVPRPGRNGALDDD